ncbi:hypothetical protein C900_05647 [Fulvivirga imtechensis AK7]|uniref:Uncharacterized protein n=1 Tax=Fulvivirga imtechensis AK7 TaxID=1237149 RepID=L8JN45_9BACT|nr:hypothetical protein [Fulvivirga imtechensis]ELR68954.1 hypothetical protein C900_05647 [Fulvivirga imtechensis AK7]
MDIKSLDNDLTSLIEKKRELSEIDYSSEDYDVMEEELHDLEDDFLEKYGDYLEDAFHEVHDEFCPDTDVLLPIAYLPGEVIPADGGYDVDFKQGVYVEVDDYPGKETKLVLLPKPTRIILQIDPQNKEVVWTAK